MQGGGGEFINLQFNYDNFATAMKALKKLKIIINLII